MKLKVGILGTGKIAALMAQTLGGMEEAEAYAVTARDKGRTAAFAKAHGIPQVYDSIEELLADPAVELVYIGTPHTLHAQQMKQCLHAGKPVLCEKPFTVNAAQAREVLALAAEKQLLVAEAVWTRYMPLAEELRGLCVNPRLGKVIGLQANLGYPDWEIQRIRDPQLAGGALLDVGIYTLTFASLVFGAEVKDVAATAVMGETGVDLQDSITLTYGDGKLASLYATVGAALDRSGRVYGDKGYAVVENINNFQSVSYYNNDHQLVEKVPAPKQITGYEYEVRAAAKALAAGDLECPQMPHSETLRILDMMDGIRQSWGLHYPCE